MRSKSYEVVGKPKVAPMTHYAAHYLRLGDYALRYPLLSLEGVRVISLGRFTEERESTIFLDGILHLEHSTYPETEGAELSQLRLVELEELQAIFEHLDVPPTLRLPND